MVDAYFIVVLRVNVSSISTGNFVSGPKVCKNLCAACNSRDSRNKPFAVIRTFMVSGGKFSMPWPLFKSPMEY